MGAKESKTLFHKKDSTILLDEEIEHLSKVTHYCIDEIKKWHAGFIKDCPRGKLKKKSFIDIYKKFYPYGKADKFCGYVFKAFDKDSSGEIDFCEFLMAVSIISQGQIKDKLKMSFDMFDIDKNGKIDAKEMATLIDAIYDLVDEKCRKGENSPGEKVKKIMEKLDTNHDGKLSLEEFVDGCLRDEQLRILLCPIIP